MSHKPPTMSEYPPIKFSSEANEWWQANRTICIDFDRVIHPYDEWEGGKLNSDPVPGAMEALVKLCQTGFHVVILTSRVMVHPGEGPEEAERHRWEILKWIQARLPFGMPLPLEITSEKVPAVLYLDDRGMRFTSWKENLPQILKLLEEEQR